MKYLKEMAESGYSADTIGPFHRHMIPWLFKSHNVPYSARIVDFGAGQGHILIPLLAHGWNKLVAVDVDDYMFDDFRERYGIHPIACDVATDRIPLEDGSVGAIACFHLIEHLLDATNLMSEAFRLLEPGGRFFLVTPDRRKDYKAFWQDPTHIHPYDKVSIARLFRMYHFDVSVHSWNARFGLGRLRAYLVCPRFGMIGKEMIAIGQKKR